MFQRIAMAALMAAMTVGCGVAQVRGNGVSRAELRAADGFDEMSANEGIEVTVAVGEQTSVSVESDENLLPFIETHVEKSVLIVEPRDGYWLAPTRAIRVTIVAPQRVTVRTTKSAEAALSSTGTRSGAEPGDAQQTELVKGSVVGGPEELPELARAVDPEMVGASAQAQ